jgi:hypothetical protein
MTTELQAAANPRNASRSTGPKTATGKARSAQNALRHGLRSELPVLPGQRADDWRNHRDGIVGSLAPAGGLETALAERVALCLWRLRRVAAYETAVTALGMQEAQEDLRHQADDPTERTDDEERLSARLASAERQLEGARAILAEGDGTVRFLEGLPDLAGAAPVSGGDVWCALQQLVATAEAHYDCDGLGDNDLLDPEDEDWLCRLGVPQDEVGDAFEWPGWTAGLLRRACEQIAQAAKVKLGRLLAWAVADGQQSKADARERLPKLEKEVKDLRRRLRTQEERLRQRRILPDDETLNKVTRYEAHLSRQLLQTLHTLERLQASRAGQCVTPPAALDVNLDVSVPPSALPAAEALGGHIDEG